MIRTNLYRYYMFGWDYNLAYDVGRRTDTNLMAKEFMEKIFRFISRDELRVTKQVAEKDYNELVQKLESQDENEKITNELFKEISEFWKGIEKTLDAELRLSEAFVLTEKRFELKKLLDKIEKLFADNVFGYMPENAKKDFDEAGKCIAFERSTSAAFHALRATEECLRVYYRKKIPRKNHVEPLLWKSMINQLRKEGKNIPKPLLDSYDNIRENFRNPTNHPETFYTLDEIQDLLPLCIDATTRIIKEIHKKKIQKK